MQNLQAQAAAIASRIQALGAQEGALSERYDADTSQVQALQTKVSQASAQLAQAEGQTSQARQALKVDALNAYINGDSAPTAGTGGDSVAQSANTSLLRAEYVNTLATDQTEAIDSYHLATLQEQAAKATLQSETKAAEAATAQVKADEIATQNTAYQLTAEESQVKGQIATLVAQQQAEEAAAAARVEQQRIAAAQAAQTAQAAQQTASQTPSAGGSSTGSSSGSSSTGSSSSGSSSGSGASQTAYTPPPSIGGAAGAVQAALSRVGDPYVWGAAGPGTFDCSGLVMWSYAQVGISLPHYSGAQYADTTHIPMSDLEPGDLVFPADPGEHVAMYIGNGDIVEAPYTGADVHVVPMGSWFVLASRVE